MWIQAALEEAAAFHVRPGSSDLSVTERDWAGLLLRQARRTGILGLPRQSFSPYHHSRA